MNERLFTCLVVGAILCFSMASGYGNIEPKKALDDYEYSHKSYEYNPNARNGGDDGSQEVDDADDGDEDADENEGRRQSEYEKKGSDDSHSHEDSDSHEDSHDHSHEHSHEHKHKHKKVKPKVIIVKKIIPLSTTTFAG